MPKFYLISVSKKDSSCVCATFSSFLHLIYYPYCTQLYNIYEPGYKTATVLLPGFAVNW